jgi:hypothetical protein
VDSERGTGYRCWCFVFRYLQTCSIQKTDSLYKLGISILEICEPSGVDESLSKRVGVR